MKFLVFVILIILAPVIAGAYGALHNQLSYSISPEFFTLFRFPEFHISPDVPPRWGAAVIGWKNTWKLGLALGIILSCAGFMHSTPKKMFRYTVESFCISLFIAFVTGLFGFFLGEFILANSTEGWSFPDGLKDTKSFMVVMRMHNFSNMGGIAGMFLGIFWQLNRRKKEEALPLVKKSDLEA